MFNREPYVEFLDHEINEKNINGINILRFFDFEGDKVIIKLLNSDVFYYNPDNNMLYLKEPNRQVLVKETYSLKFEVFDGTSKTIHKTSVDLMPINDDTIINIVSQNGQEKQKIAAIFKVTDVDDTILSYELYDNNNIFELDGFNIVLRNEYKHIINIENYIVSLKVTDSKDNIYVTDINITLYPDNDPVIVSFDRENIINEKNLNIGTISFNDPENQNVILSLNDDRFEIVNNKIYFKEPRQFINDENFNITITAIDEQGLSTEYEISFTIHAVNDIPVIVNDDQYNIQEENKIIFTIDAIDPENKHISYQLIDVSGKFILNGNNIEIIDTDVEILINETYNVKLIVTDEEGLITEKNITIILEPKNDIPIIIMDYNYTGKEKIQYIAEIGVTDRDNNDFIYSLENDYGIFKIVDNKILLIDPYRQISEIENYELKVIVNDNNGGIVYKIVSVSIDIDNDTPIITVSGGTYQEEIENVGLYNIDDPENDLTETILENDYGIFRLHNGVIKIYTDIEVLVPTQYDLNIITTDIHGATSNKYVSIIIEPKNDLSIVSSNVYITNENSTNKIADFSIYDRDSTTFTKTLIDNSGKFILVGNEIFLKNPGDDLISDINTILTIEVNDGIDSVYHDINVNVSRVNDSIDDISLSNRIIPYNYTGVISFLDIFEKDKLDVYTYTVNDERFTIDNGTLIINEGSVFNGGSFSITITVVDEAGHTIQKDFNMSAFTPTIAINPDTGEELDPTQFKIINGILFIGKDNYNENFDGYIGKIIPLTMSLEGIVYQTNSPHFTVDQNGNVYTNIVNFEMEDLTYFNINVHNEDDEKNATFTFNINDINEPITNISSSNEIVLENTTNIAVSTINLIDQDQNDIYTYILLNHTDTFRFIDNKITLIREINYENENSFELDIRVYDSGNHYIDHSLVININNVNENPTDIIITNTFTENDSLGSELLISNIDDDIDNTYVYTLLNNNDTFEIQDNKLILIKQLDYNINQNYTLELQVFDGQNIFNKSIVLNITDFNYSPVDIIVYNLSINENYSGFIANMVTIDHDINETFTYTILNNNKFFISNDKLYTNTTFDYEEIKLQNIKVQVIDSGGNVYIKEFNIDIININEPPHIITLDKNDINENITGIIGKISSFDTEGPVSLEVLNNTNYSIIDGNLILNNSFNYENIINEAIIVRATDIDNQIYDKTFIISVNNVNESPYDISLSNNIVSENSIGSFGTLTGYDYESGVNLSVINNTRYSISGSSLILNSAYNYEAQTSDTVTIRATDSGGLTYDETFNITVNNVLEYPIFYDTSTYRSATYGTYLDFRAYDPDGYSSMSYSFSGSDASTFSNYGNGNIYLYNDTLNINGWFSAHHALELYVYNPKTGSWRYIAGEGADNDSGYEYYNTSITFAEAKYGYFSLWDRSDGSVSYSSMSTYQGYKSGGLSDGGPDTNATFNYNLDTILNVSMTVYDAHGYSNTLYVTIDGY